MPVIPTKGNLLNIKKSLNLAKLGYSLLDRKRNILIREMMSLIDDAKAIRGEIEGTYQDAYLALQRANITLGVCENAAKAVPVETGVQVTYRSVMGVEIPHVSLHPQPVKVYYGFQATNAALDKAFILFQRVKKLTAALAEIENSVYRLANAIKKTQKRANALKNIIIPRFEADSKFITDALEEKEREDFSRLKLIKKNR
ncbi:MAG: V-type ATP synthase subunit D [Oscillospiraceae bacterium]|nr:V-type ATP synthase subunit D [Oscillospiraceae bacterium]